MLRWFKNLFAKRESGHEEQPNQQLNNTSSVSSNTLNQVAPGLYDESPKKMVENLDRMNQGQSPEKEMRDFQDQLRRGGS
jgi:hypothetical protein